MKKLVETLALTVGIMFLFAGFTRNNLDIIAFGMLILTVKIVMYMKRTEC